MIDQTHKRLRVGITIGRKEYHRQGFAYGVLKAAFGYVFYKMKYIKFLRGFQREKSFFEKQFV